MWSLCALEAERKRGWRRIARSMRPAWSASGDPDDHDGLAARCVPRWDREGLPGSGCAPTRHHDHLWVIGVADPHLYHDAGDLSACSTAASPQARQGAEAGGTGEPEPVGAPAE